MTNLVTDILLLTGLGAFSALLLVITRDRLEPKTTSLITLINSQLPQTQCAQCGYPGCKPYAEAIANGESMEKVKSAARKGADATKEITDTKFGRSSYLSEDSLKNVPDPGAEVVARVFEKLAAIK
mgnify:CR=1 FL=1